MNYQDLKHYAKPPAKSGKGITTILVMSNLLLMLALALAIEPPDGEQSDTRLASQEIIACHQDDVPDASGMQNASVYLLDVKN